LLPVFDAAETLPACLRSIIRQTEPGWECVIVDDGSSDASLACARRFAEQDPRFRVMALPHRGLVETLNAGLTECHASYVARMDADDLMHRERLARQLAFLGADATLSAVACHVRFFPRTRLTSGLRDYERWLESVDSPRRIREDALIECPVVHPSLVIRTSTLRELGYRDCGWPEDYDLVLRLLARGHEIGVVPRRLLCWRDGAGRLTRTGPAYRRERFDELKAAALAEGFLAGSPTYVLWGYGHTGRRLRRALLRHGKQPSHIVELHPGRLGQRIHGAPVISPEELASLPRGRLIASVAGEAPRAEIRAALHRLGYRELTDFVCVA
jgi:glycosyltransferase involved in cell wall biosynthesis